MVDLIGIIFYLIFGKGVVQDWAREPEPEQSLGEFARKLSAIVRNLPSKSSSFTSIKKNTTDGSDYKRFIFYFSLKQKVFRMSDSRKQSANISTIEESSFSQPVENKPVFTAEPKDPRD